MKTNSLLFTLKIALLLSVPAVAAVPHLETAETPSLGPRADAFETVKMRTVELLRGGASSGPFRRRVTERADAFASSILGIEFEPIERIDEDAVATTSHAKARAGRIRRLALAFTDPNGDFYENPELLARIQTELEDLLTLYGTRAEKEGNWHSWMIAIPLDLGTVGLLLEDSLEHGLLKALIVAMGTRLEEMVLTGANASWEARNHILLALLTGDVSRLSKAAERVFVDVRYSSVGGVREDYAYMFHGQIPYAGTYGAGFVQTVAQFVYLFSGTRWAIPEEKAEVISNLILEHTQWFILGEQIDRSIVGRGYERRISSGPVLEAMLLLVQSDLPGSETLARVAKAQILSGAQPDSSVASWADNLIASDISPLFPEGFRYWPSGEMGAFRGEGFHVGFRQYSRRVQDYEYLIRQGGEGWNLAMGAVNILRPDGSGDWYDRDGLLEGIEMEFLTNVTSRQGANPVNSKVEYFYNWGSSMNYGTARLAGGCGWSDGGVAGFVLAPPYGDIIAHKSLHFFPEGYWSIGSNISVTKQPAADAGPVRTNLIQWVSESSDPVIRTSEGDEIVAGGIPQRIEGVEWLWIDNLGVVPAEPTDLMLVGEGRVVTVWIDHGRAPESESFACAVLPASSLRETMEFAESKPVWPVRRDARTHAVRSADGSRVSLAFFEPDSCAGVTVDHPAMVYRNSRTDGEVYSFQNPLHDDADIEVVCDLKGDPGYMDPAISLKRSEDDSSVRLTMDSILGRTCLIATGELGKSVRPLPREDLEGLHRFSVSAQSSSEETFLTLKMPPDWKRSDYRISIHGSSGHHLTYLDADDIVETLPDNVVRYRWDRAPPDRDVGINQNLLQRFGDFRIWYETDMLIGVDYFSIPKYDAAGNPIEDMESLPDLNSPYRSR